MLKVQASTVPSGAGTNWGHLGQAQTQHSRSLCLHDGICVTNQEPFAITRSDELLRMSPFVPLLAESY